MFLSQDENKSRPTGSNNITTKDKNGGDNANAECNMVPLRSPVTEQACYLKSDSNNGDEGSYILLTTKTLHQLMYEIIIH